MSDQPERLVHMRPAGLSTGTGFSIGDETTNELGHALASFRSRLESRRLPGSEHLTFGELLDRPNLTMPINALGTRGSLTGQARTLLDTLRSRQSSGRFLFVAPPGMGKSTLAALLWCELMDERADDPEKPLPLLIDLRSYRGLDLDAEFGTEGHMVSEIRSMLDIGAGQAIPNPRRVSKDHRTRVFLILDSLDELMSGRPQSEVISLVDRPLLRVADIVFSRVQFYEQYLQDTEFAREREVFRLQEWPKANVERYVREYYRLQHGDKAEDVAETLLTRLDSTPALRQIVSVPIRLNMVLELYGTAEEAGDEIPKRPSLLRVYEAFTRRALRVDAANRGTTIPIDQKFDLLERLAWRFYDDGAVGPARPLSFTEREVDLIIRDVQPTLDDRQRSRLREELVDSGIVVSLRGGGLVGRGAMDFAHKSFQEFLVASMAQVAMCDSFELLVEMFTRNLSPEVTEFLKEAIDEINSFGRYQRLASQTIISAIKSLGEGAWHSLPPTTDYSLKTPNTQAAIQRLTCEQLCYFLGNIESLDARRYLLDRLRNEIDPWIRRGIILGLAFGGEIGPLHHYVETLTAERASGGPYPLNESNIGAQLSWFGDQPFDAARPDLDEGGPECGRTVGRLIYQLGTTTNQPNWRLDLYTILDLWRHRPASELSFLDVTSLHLEDLKRIHRSLEQDIEAVRWPEIGFLRGLIDELQVR